MFRWLQYLYRERSRTGWLAPAEAAPPSTADAAEADRDPTSLAWRYTEHALVYMKHVSERHGARFLMAPIGNDRQMEILRDIARRHAIDLVDPSGLKSTPTPSFLPNDGHFSPDGARRMADLIGAYIDERARDRSRAR